MWQNIGNSNEYKKVIFIATCIISLCGLSSCSKDEDPDWIINKAIISKGKWDSGNILDSWSDTIYNKSEEYIMAEVALFKSKTDENYRYAATYRKF